jgi:predicted DNA-binding transcriptional regulator AlpA
MAAQLDGALRSHESRGNLGAGRSASDAKHSGRWWTIRQIALDLGVSVDTVYKWSSRGQPDFPRAIRLRNGEVRVRDDWYEAWLATLE